LMNAQPLMKSRLASSVTIPGIAALLLFAVQQKGKQDAATICVRAVQFHVRP
jgi:hypothetical protein